ARGGMGTAVKVAIIIGVILAGLLVLAVAIVLFAGWWITSTGAQVATDGIIGPESGAIFHTGRPEDGVGFEQFAGRVIIEVQRISLEQQRQDLPPALEWLREMQLQQSTTGLEIYVPKELTLTVEPGHSWDEIEVLLAANPRAFTKLFRFMFTRLFDDHVEAGRVRGRDVYQFTDGPAVAFVGGTIVFGTDAEIVGRALERLEDGAQAVESSLQKLYRQKDGSRTFHIVAERLPAIFESPAVRDVIGAGFDEPPTDDEIDALVGMGGLTTFIVGGLFPDANTIEAEISAVTWNERGAAAWEELLAERWPTALREYVAEHAPLAADEFELIVEIERVGQPAKARYRIENAATTYAHLLGSGTDEPRVLEDYQEDEDHDESGGETR
ncbi:MAG: hypothetical protein JSV80_08820, partial [Acidobacteriota bacterium]